MAYKFDYVNSRPTSSGASKFDVAIGQWVIGSVVTFPNSGGVRFFGRDTNGEAMCEDYPSIDAFERALTPCDK